VRDSICIRHTTSGWSSAASRTFRGCGRKGPSAPSAAGAVFRVEAKRGHTLEHAARNSDAALSRRPGSAGSGGCCGGCGPRARRIPFEVVEHKLAVAPIVALVRSAHPCGRRRSRKAVPDVALAVGAARAIRRKFAAGRESTSVLGSANFHWWYWTAPIEEIHTTELATDILLDDKAFVERASVDGFRVFPCVDPVPILAGPGPEFQGVVVFEAAHHSRAKAAFQSRVPIGRPGDRVSGAAASSLPVEQIDVLVWRLRVPVGDRDALVKLLAMLVGGKLPPSHWRCRNVVSPHAIRHGWCWRQIRCWRPAAA